MGGIVGAAAAGAQCVAPGSPRVLTPNSALSPRVLTIIIFFLHRAHLSCPPVTAPGPPPEQLVYCLTSGWMHHYHYLRTTFLPATTPPLPNTHRDTRTLLPQRHLFPATGRTGLECFQTYLAAGCLGKDICGPCRRRRRGQAKTEEAA